MIPYEEAARRPWQRVEARPGDRVGELREQAEHRIHQQRRGDGREQLRPAALHLRTPPQGAQRAAHENQRAERAHEMRRAERGFNVGLNAEGRVPQEVEAAADGHQHDPAQRGQIAARQRLQPAMAAVDVAQLCAHQEEPLGQHARVEQQVEGREEGVVGGAVHVGDAVHIAAQQHPGCQRQGKQIEAERGRRVTLPPRPAGGHTQAGLNAFRASHTAPLASMSPTLAYSRWPFPTLPTPPPHFYTAQASADERRAGRLM